MKCVSVFVAWKLLQVAVLCEWSCHGYRVKELDAGFADYLLQFIFLNSLSPSLFQSFCLNTILQRWNRMGYTPHTGLLFHRHTGSV